MKHLIKAIKKVTAIDLSKFHEKDMAPSTAIWFQAQDDGKLKAWVAVVNGKYHYEIYNRITGKTVEKGDEATLPLAKKKVLQYLDTHKQRELMKHLVKAIKKVVASDIQVWEMTKNEYEKKFGKPKQNTSLTGGFHPHKEAVDTALNQGKKVPANVLKDYPDLIKKHNIQASNNVNFYLNGDGMTNVHPNINTKSTSSGKWYFEMPEKDFLKYLSKNEIYIDDHSEKILDNSDGHNYGQVLS